MSEIFARSHEVPGPGPRSHPGPAMATDALAPLAALTVTHRAVGLDRLRGLAFGSAGARRLHDALSAAQIESFVVATCNRTEVYWRSRGPADHLAVRRAFDAVAGPGAFDSWIAAAGTFLTGQAAAQHLFRVCAGLESMLLGEAEILGQVRAALDASPGAGPFLGGVVRAALRAGGLARAETGIGIGALSVASAAVQVLAGRLPLTRARVVVVGAGDTGRKTARHLQALGVDRLVFLNRTLAHAQVAAESLHASAAGLGQLALELRDADAVVCAVEARSHVIGLAELRQATAARPDRPLVVVDLSMPSAVEPGEVHGVTRVDLQAIEAHVAGQRGRRSAEIPKVESVIGRELRQLERWAAREAIRPAARRTAAIGARPCS